MRRRGIHLLLITFVSVVLMGAITGCAQPPVEQLEAAKKAVELARAAGAAEYAREGLAKLEREFALANEELVGQGHVISIFQSYVDVEDLLEKVHEGARQVEVTAAHNKEMTKTVARTMEQEAKQVLTLARKFMSRRPIGPARASRTIIEQELTGLEKDLHGVAQLIEHGDYLDAEKQARILREKTLVVSDKIRQLSPNTPDTFGHMRLRS